MQKATLVVALLGFICTPIGSVKAQNSELLSQAGFGYSVDVTGSQIIVGEPLNQRFPGIVYVFERQGPDWSLSSKLQASDASVGDHFGTSLASGDHLLFVGSTGAEDLSGGIYVFSENADRRWAERAVIRPDSVEPGDAFGQVLTYSNGRLFASLVPTDGDPEVFVYEMGSQPGEWRKSSVIHPDSAETSRDFGAALASNGEMLLVGSPHDGGGVVHIYTRGADGAWTHSNVLSGSTQRMNVHGMKSSDKSGSSEAFGSRLLLTPDRLYVTAPNADRFTGKVYSFVREKDGSFQRGPNLTPFDAQSGHAFARDVVLTGNEVVVSALTPGQSSGAIYSMRMSDSGNEVLSARKFVEPRALRFTFYGEVMDSDQDLLAVTAYQDVFEAGAVYVYQRDEKTGDWSTGTKLMAPSLNAYTSVTGGKVKCEDGSADGFGCDHVDIVSFLTDEDLGMERGMRTNDLWGWTDAKTGKEYALLGRNDGTSFVDLGDPENPVDLGFLPRTAGSPPSIWRDIKVYKDHAFIVADGAGAHGIQIFDLTQLRHVKNPPVLFKETAHYDGIASAHNIVINQETGFAYTVGNSMGGKTCGGGSHMIDIKDPTHPKFVGCFAHEGTGRARTGYTHDAQCVTYKGPDERYHGHEICFAANETAISIADVTDKDNPVALARGDYPNPGYTHQGWLSEDHRYFFLDDELDELNGTTDGTRTLIWDVAELDDPVLVNEYVSANRATDHNLYIKGHYMYQSNYVSGLRVVDVSNVEAPVEVAHFDTVPWGEDKPGFGGSWSNYPFFKSGVIIVSSGEEGLFVLKRSQVDS